MTNTPDSASTAANQGAYKIVISWRRSCPSAGTVHRLYDRLAERYGKEVIFFDLETMREGNFPMQISKAISEASVLLVVIGRDWAGTDGAIDRIIDPKDWVYQEIRTAYERRKKSRKKPIILFPVSIDGASVPNHPDLKKIPCLKHLIYNHALPLTGNRDLAGVTKLIERLDTYVPRRNQTEATLEGATGGGKPRTPIHVRTRVIAGCVAIGLVVICALVMRNAGWRQPTAKDEPSSAPKKDEPSSAPKTVEAAPTAKSDDRTPATIRVVGTRIEVVTSMDRVLKGGLGQETRLKGSVLVSTHPESGFALLNVTLADLADLVVVVWQDGQETVATPFEYGNGYGYVPGEASADKPAEIRLYLKKK